MDRPTPSTLPPRSAGLFLAAAVALAALLRLPCLHAELWLDEVWSWEFARAAATPWEIFAGPNHHHDNNHKLNTLYLYFVPDGLPYPWYRLHSLAAGLAAVPLAFRAAARRGALAALFAALLVAADYWFVLCSAEARGYALALALALAAFDGLQRYLRDGRPPYLLQFWLAVMLGFLAHLTFLPTYLALVVWSVYHFARHRLTKGSEVHQLVRVHAVPACFVLVLYFADIRGMQLGGGDALPLYVTVGRLLCFGLGAPFSPLNAGLAAVAVFAVLARGWRVLRRDGDDSWVFFLMATVGGPLMLLARQSGFVYERYFFQSFLFFLILLAYVLADLARRGPAGKVAAGVAVGLICAGNLGEVADFLRGDGRGHFRRALEYIAEQSDGREVTVTSDSDLRVPKMLAFYNHYQKPPLRYEYVGLDDWKERAFRYGSLAGPTGRFGYSRLHTAEWLIVESPEHVVRDPPDRLEFPGAADATYELEAKYEVGARGGWDWYVYRRVVVAP
jgi:hypothetical protein